MAEVKRFNPETAEKRWRAQRKGETEPVGRLEAKTSFSDCRCRMVRGAEYKEKNRARLVRVDPAKYFAEQVGDDWPEGGEDGDADSDDPGEGLRT